MKRKSLKIALASAVFTIVLGASAFAANIGGGTVTASALNLRSEPNTTSSVVTTAPRGATMVLLDRGAKTWYKVWYNGQTGYMCSDYIAPVVTLNSPFGTGTIKGSDVRMRAGASTSSNTLGYYSSGTQMSVIGVSGGWYKVSYNGTTGYVSSDYMTLSAGSSSGSTASGAQQNTGTVSGSIGDQIVATAKKYLGVPYVWAGTSPSGFDCSGFVYYVFRELGYSINRTAASIYSNGTYVDRSNLQPGDVICFSNSGYGYIGHVGIYIGNNQVIHASSGSGRVIISDLSASYYNNHYYGARRIAS